MIYYDPTGNVPIETVADIASIDWSAKDLISNPSWANAGFLLWDIGSALIPYIPGSYVAKGGKLLSKLDDIEDAASAAKKIPFKINLQLFAQEAGKATRETLLEGVSNQKLKNTIDQIYRPGAKVGEGGLADAIRHELKTGELVGGKSHLTKGQERVRNLKNILKSQDLSPSDKAIAENLLNDLKNALGGR